MIDTDPIRDAIVTAIAAGTYDEASIRAEVLRDTGRMAIPGPAVYVVAAPGFVVDEAIGEGFVLEASIWQLKLVTKQQNDIATAFALAVLDALSEDITLGGLTPSCTPIEIPPPDQRDTGSEGKGRKLYERTVTLRVEH